MFWVNHSINTIRIIPFIGGWLADRLLGDPIGWPHLISGFGKLISIGEKELNKGENRILKGAFFALVLVVGIYGISKSILLFTNTNYPQFSALITGIGVFYCLAGKTLIDEVKAVFNAVNNNIEEGRKQVSRVVGRDTTNLSSHEIKTAALETLAENLSDGVVAPMFWFAILGLPGMVAYKMINTLDSMIGYKNDRYIEFGLFAARLDDIANYIPARLTAYLMLLVSGSWEKRSFVEHFGKAHTSPNSGYPEAALAAILNCRFGGTHDYFGKPINKPFIGVNERAFTFEDLEKAIQVNNHTEMVMGMLVSITLLFQYY